jgi:hypothetical protein
LKFSPTIRIWSASTLTHLILEESGPTLTCTKGEHNVIVDTLSQLDLTEKDFSSDAFAVDQDNAPEDFPFSCAIAAQEQPNDPELMDRCGSSELCDKTVCKHADKECELITRTDTGTNQSKIVIPSHCRIRLPNDTIFTFCTLVKPEQN